MSVNFYNGWGIMGGFDVHNFIVLPAIPMPAPHMVFIAGFGISLGTFYKDTDTVSSEGCDMIQEGYDWYLIPHIPIPVGPPSPGEAFELGLIIINSSSKPFMSVHSVTGEGEPLATTVSGLTGLNTNCGEGFSLPSGVVLQLNSVITTPTLDDWVHAVVDLVFDNVVDHFVDKGLEKIFGEEEKKIAISVIKHIIRRLPDIVKALGSEESVVNWVVDLPGTLKGIVQKVVDGESLSGGEE